MDEKRDTSPATPSTTGSRLEEAVGVNRADDEVEAEQAPENQYLCFEISGSLFAVLSSEVEEVVGAAKTYQVPHVPAFIRGMFNRHGILTPILDLAMLRGTPVENNPRRLVTLRAGLLEAALPVTRVVGVFSAADDQVQTSIEDAADYVSGLLHVDGEVYTLIDTDLLLRHTRSDPHRDGSTG